MTPPAWACPACRGVLCAAGEALACERCARTFPVVAGVPDLRLESDRYLSLEADRAKALRLAELAEGRDLRALAGAYYAMTADVDASRRGRFLAHLQRAEARGAGLAALLPARGRVLEMGCGSGGLLAAAAGARAGRAIVGVDIALRWLIVARRRLADRGQSAPLVAASASALPWGDGSFDAVVADSLLEHLDEPALALRECARVLRPGGRLIVWSPNRFSLLRDPHVGLWGLGWLPRRWQVRYVRGRLGCDWPLCLLSRGEARRLAAAQGFVNVRVQAPCLALAEPQASSWAEGLALRAYRGARLAPLLGPLVARFGPLWELTATRGEGPP